MKYTKISSQNSELLENLIVKYGQIVTVQQIFSEAAAFLNHKQTEYFMTILTKQGWLVRIKRGLYAISDFSTRGFLSLSSPLVANLLVKDSYVSFESALHHYGMFDQFISTVISVSLKAYKTVKLQGIQYRYVKTKAKYYFGWQEVKKDNAMIRIATREKALIDMVNFHKSIYAIDLVIEKLREYKKDLDFLRLNEYVSQFSMTTIKIFGVIFDLLHIDSSSLLNRVKQSKGAHRMVGDARLFNAKWRLYCDAYFETYKNH